jgi:hypothetical protein
MKTFDSIFNKLVEKHGPEILAEFSIYIQNEISSNYVLYNNAKSIANIELKELIEKYEKANNLIEENNLGRLNSKDSKIIELIYIKDLTELKKSESVKRLTFILKTYLENQKIISLNESENIDLPEQVNHLLEDFNFSFDNNKITQTILLLLKRLVDNIENREMNDEAYEEHRNWKEFEKMMDDSATFYDEEKIDICPLCDESPCRCSDSTV